MPVVDRAEARDVSEINEQMLRADGCAAAIGYLQPFFVEKLDFRPVAGPVPLHHDSLPAETTRRKADTRIWRCLSHSNRALGDRYRLNPSESDEGPTPTTDAKDVRFICFDALAEL